MISDIRIMIGGDIVDLPVCFAQFKINLKLVKFKTLFYHSSVIKKSSNK